VNPFACRVALRPRGPLESLDLTLRFVRGNGRVWLRLGALLVLPALGAATALCVAFEGHPALLAFPIAVAPLLQAPATALGGKQLFADGVKVREALHTCLRRALPILAVWGVWLGVVLGGCGVVSWLLAVPFVWVTEAAVLEEVSPGRAMLRSVRLSTHHLGVSLAAVFGWYLLTGWGAVAGEVLGQGLVRDLLQFGTPFGVATDGIATPYTIAGMLAAQPLYGAYRLMLYLDVRTRVETWDLQIALRAVGLAARKEAA
jgi:hypothetical protein